MSIPKKILIIENLCVESSRRSIYRKLAERKEFQVHLLVPKVWKEAGYPIKCEEETNSSLILHKSGFIMGYRAHRVLYTNIIHILLKVKPDIIFMDSEPESYASLQVQILKNILAPKAKTVVMSWRNIDYPSNIYPYKFPKLNGFVERKVLAKMDHCVAHNETAKKIFNKKGVNDITIIPPAIDLNVFHKIDSSTVKDEFNLKSFTIGFVGRFIPEKGIDTLLYAVKDLPFDYKILLVGNGKAKQSWLQITNELGINDRIIWNYSVPHAEIPKLLNAIDLIVLPSYASSHWKEQFGRILIEAMACEVPVIGSNSGEIPWVIGDAGLIFEEQNVGDLKNKIQMIYQNKILRQVLIKKGLERVKSKFSVEVVSEQYYKLFSDLLKERKA
ncbi:MAG: glycosyltransferase [Bacteroidota bacterium]|nr:glycosyltransferase [Bacteroidota bacterium]